VDRETIQPMDSRAADNFVAAHPVLLLQTETPALPTYLTFIVDWVSPAAASCKSRGQAWSYLYEAGFPPPGDHLLDELCRDRLTGCQPGGQGCRTRSCDKSGGLIALFTRIL
jgi:hypothetical protein